MNAFERRLAQRQDELDWLYMELYHDRDRLDGLKAMMARAYGGRGEGLRRLDKKREAGPEWFRACKMLGVTMYPGLFAGSLKGVEEKLGYLKEQGITYVHLMPLLKMPHPDNDGGYAVEDFNQVDPTLGSNGDLARLGERAGRRHAPPGDEPVPGFCHQPHRRHPRLGHAGQGGGAGVSGPLYLL